MSTTTIAKSQNRKSEQSPVKDVRKESITTFERKAEEMKAFIKRNPIPKELLRN